MSQKFCTDCKHGRLSPDFAQETGKDKEFMRCTRKSPFIEFAPGKFVGNSEYCNAERMKVSWLYSRLTGHCGPEARYFEPKDAMLAAREGK